MAQIFAIEQGIINNAFINNMPTNLIDTAKINDTKKIKIHRTFCSFMPSTTAHSLLMVININLSQRHNMLAKIIRSTEKIQTKSALVIDKISPQRYDKRSILVFLSKVTVISPKAKIEWDKMLKVVSLVNFLLLDKVVKIIAIIKQVKIKP